ncbi:FepA family TonB-dependent siderophore receptor [Halotalea alkalilenta]|uniref:FepA family TonB-dependent siderophore receptor n=1 Tax=Halotalea alkalilenta TaxID=376489 RepID=UPI000488E332|nr:FepA family TonB-dependent siderophore receptor [Halotalea alkalilenta]
MITTRRHPMAIAVALGLGLGCTTAYAQTTTDPLEQAARSEEESDTALSLDEIVVLGTAAEQTRQMPGVSIIGEQELERRPPANDLSEIIRRQPGVNLTGNSATGQYGNNRQIDLRGMGPENTLIMIDGRPVLSRNAVRMGRSGERNTRGDSNWVPAEAIERIEVIRGPAAARYGSGASGGVVNIITRPPTDKHSATLTAYSKMPENGDEGSSQRAGFVFSGPLSRTLSYRMFGNLNKTDADSLDLNRQFQVDPNPPPAGREGVENKDINGLLRWQLADNQSLEFEAGYARQGNIFAGEWAGASNAPYAAELWGDETNVMYRRTVAITHRGEWDFGSSRITLQQENTRNYRLGEGLAGGGEGTISPTSTWNQSELDNYYFNGELDLPITGGRFNQVVTVGTTLTREKLDDPYSVTSSPTITDFPQTRNGSAQTDADNYAAYIEDNIELTERLIVTPGIRFDHHSEFGDNWSPSLNGSFAVTDAVTVQAGVARAFKAPNLYQSNPNYVYTTMGNGCPDGVTGPCYIQGNANLEAETSLNKEIGISYVENGWNTGLTYFHNDYKNKIVAGLGSGGEVTSVPSGGNVYQWTNASKAVVQGLEGNVNVPLLGPDGTVLSWNNNLTYMIENRNKDTREPLSVIPKYTINSSLDWQATDQLFLAATVTHYGKQEPRHRTSSGSDATGATLSKRGSYTLFGLNASYEVNDNLSLSAGIDNLFDKQIYRQSSQGQTGANSYNEPGRAYWVSMTSRF